MKKLSSLMLVIQVAVGTAAFGDETKAQLLNSIRNRIKTSGDPRLGSLAEPLERLTRDELQKIRDELRQTNWDPGYFTEEVRARILTDAKKRGYSPPPPQPLPILNPKFTPNGAITGTPIFVLDGDKTVEGTVLLDPKAIGLKSGTPVDLLDPEIAREINDWSFYAKPRNAQRAFYNPRLPLTLRVPGEPDKQIQISVNTLLNALSVLRTKSITINNPNYVLENRSATATAVGLGVDFKGGRYKVGFTFPEAGGSENEPQWLYWNENGQLDGFESEASRAEKFRSELRPQLEAAKEESNSHAEAMLKVLEATEVLAARQKLEKDALWSRVEPLLNSNLRKLMTESSPETSKVVAKLLALSPQKPLNALGELSKPLPLVRELAAHAAKQTSDPEEYLDLAALEHTLVQVEATGHWSQNNKPEVVTSWKDFAERFDKTPGEALLAFGNRMLSAMEKPPINLRESGREMYSRQRSDLKALAQEALKHPSDEATRFVGAVLAKYSKEDEGFYPLQRGLALMRNKVARQDRRDRKAARVQELDQIISDPESSPAAKALALCTRSIIATLP